MAYRVYKAIFIRNSEAVLVYFFLSEKPDLEKLSEQLKVLMKKSGENVVDCKWTEHEWGIVCKAGNWRIEIVEVNI